MMADDQRFRAADRVAAKEVGGELVLLDLEDGSFFTARGTGPRVWDLAASGASVEAFVADLVEASRLRWTSAISPRDAQGRVDLGPW
jgi:hypothetical protein